MDLTPENVMQACVAPVLAFWRHSRYKVASALYRPISCQSSAAGSPELGWAESGDASCDLIAFQSDNELHSRSARYCRLGRLICFNFSVKNDSYKTCFIGTHSSAAGTRYSVKEDSRRSLHTAELSYLLHPSCTISHRLKYSINQTPNTYVLPLGDVVLKTRLPTGLLIPLMEAQL